MTNKEKVLLMSKSEELMQILLSEISEYSRKQANMLDLQKYEFEGFSSADNNLPFGTLFSIFHTIKSL
jgi:hypothetical protein